MTLTEKINIILRKCKATDTKLGLHNIIYKAAFQHGSKIFPLRGRFPKTISATIEL
jgi:hypothetical protein